MAQTAEVIEMSKSKLVETVRSPSELGPLIKEQVELGDMAAEEAGMPYYRKAGGYLLEAKIYKKSKGEYSQEWFEDYCRTNTKTTLYPEGRGGRQGNLWINAHREEVAAIEDARKKGKSTAHAHRKLSNTLDELRGASSVGRVYREYTDAVDAAVETARRQQLRVAEDRITEQKRTQELARKLIDIGYKVLAKELHPDKMGGSKDAMSRLNKIRERLSHVYG
jgi:hypothetical protein